MYVLRARFCQKHTHSLTGMYSPYDLVCSRFLQSLRQYGDSKTHTTREKGPIRGSLKGGKKDPIPT